MLTFKVTLLLWPRSETEEGDDHSPSSHESRVFPMRKLPVQKVFEPPDTYSKSDLGDHNGNS